MGIKRLIVFIIILLVIDLSYSFLQHFHVHLDGDIAETVVPASWIYKLFKDPFGLQEIYIETPYPNPNRFFSHWSMFVYMRNIPHLLQYVFDPINSIYLSCALFKTLLQFLIIGLIAIISTCRKEGWKLADLLLSALIVTPLFQTEGYNRYMGIIDQSITYTFFYAYPMLLLLVFYSIIYVTEIKQKGYSFTVKLILGILVLFLPFSGPLIPGVTIISAPLILLQRGISYFRKCSDPSFYKKVIFSLSSIPGYLRFVLFLIIVTSAYSLYVGSFNSNNAIHNLSIGDRFYRLPLGLYNILSTKLGWPILLIMTGINIYIVRWFKLSASSLLTMFKWIGIFISIYLLSLPFGGFRIYRPNIVRYDTILPITICIITMYSISAIFIMKNLSNKFRTAYIFVLILVSFIFSFADIHKLNGNDCEKSALKKIALSPQNIVVINSDCTVLSWEKINDPSQSEMNARLLKYWNVTKEKKLYYQR